MGDLNPLGKGLFGNYKSDIPAGFVVFLVALPLCLGIALASGAPLFSGIIAGIIIGMLFAVFNILMSNYRTPFIFEKSDRREGALILKMGQEVSFLNKGALIQALNSVGNGCKVIIDATKSETVDYDIIEVVKDFQEQAKYRDIEVEVVGFSYRMSKNYYKEFVNAVKNPD